MVLRVNNMAKFIKHINLDDFNMFNISTTTIDINYVNISTTTIDTNYVNVPNSDTKLESPKIKHLKELSCRYCKGEIDSETLECKYCGRKYYYE